MSVRARAATATPWNGWGPPALCRGSMGLTSMEKHPPDVSLPGGFLLNPGGFQYSSAVQTLAWVLFLFLPVLHRAGSECGAGCGSIGNSILKIGNSLVIFVNGKADKEFWWSICKCRKCPHHLPHRCISASLTLFRTDGAGYGFPFPNSECDGLGRVVEARDQNVIY